MEYEVFVEQFLTELKQNMETKEIEIHRRKVTKTNGIIKDGISVWYSDSNVAPTMYLDDLYEMHKGGRSINELADTTARVLENKNMTPEMPVLTTESAKENLYCAIINSAENEEMLKNAPHEKLEDLSVVARFRVGEDGSFLVTNDICKVLQMTSEEVMEVAHANTNKTKYKCQNMSAIIRELMIQDGVPESFADELIRQTQEGSDIMWVLSNESKIDGAVAITSQDALKAAHDRLGEDFYVLPSSRHEVILVPKSIVSNVEDLKVMVHEVNVTEVQDVDKLSDSVYIFNGRYLSIVNA